ncbi:RteC domain-containing protein [Pedobacter sp.]|uniref:RteC domain-containing protein n=1 Tax=Pedobacter sp. TaxID=1411316 RepID=UPI003BA8B147
MKLKKLSEKLHGQLLQDLPEIEEISDGLERLRAGLALVQKALGTLRIELARMGFSGDAEEIDFFKTGKPRIYSMLIFLTERYAIENNMPRFDKGKQQAYLESQLVFIERFFRQNSFLYEYYRLGASDLDNQYFIRSHAAHPAGYAEVPDVDPSFSTVADYLFSKFIAYERLLVYLKDSIQMHSGAAGPGSDQAKKLRWTGEAVNIVELVYGVYETAQVNEGKITLSELMEFFGQTFQVNVSSYFKRFADIKRRKSMSKTRYLDEMQKLVAKRIEDSDVWIPEDQRSRYGY